MPPLVRGRAAQIFAGLAFLTTGFRSPGNPALEAELSRQHGRLQAAIRAHGGSWLKDVPSVQVRSLWPCP